MGRAGVKPPEREAPKSSGRARPKPSATNPLTDLSIAATGSSGASRMIVIKHPKGGGAEGLAETSAVHIGRTAGKWAETDWIDRHKKPATEILQTAIEKANRGLPENQKIGVPDAEGVHRPSFADIREKQYELALKQVEKIKDIDIQGVAHRTLREEFPETAGPRKLETVTGLGADEGSNVVVEPNRDKSGKKIARPGIIGGGDENKGIKKTGARKAAFDRSREIAEVGTNKTIEKALQILQKIGETGDPNNSKDVRKYNRAKQRFLEALDAELVVAGEFSTYDPTRTGDRKSEQTGESKDRKGVYGTESSQKFGSEMEGTSVDEPRQVQDRMYRQAIANPRILEKLKDKFRWADWNAYSEKLDALTSKPGSKTHAMESAEILRGVVKGMSLEAAAKNQAINKASGSRVPSQPSGLSMSGATLIENKDIIKQLRRIEDGSFRYPATSKGRRMLQEISTDLAQFVEIPKEKALSIIVKAQAGTTGPLTSLLKEIQDSAELSAGEKIAATPATGSILDTLFGEQGGGKRNPNTSALEAGIGPARGADKMMGRGQGGTNYKKTDIGDTQGNRNRDRRNILTSMKRIEDAPYEPPAHGQDLPTLQNKARQAKIEAEDKLKPDYFERLAATARTNAAMNKSSDLKELWEEKARQYLGETTTIDGITTSNTKHIEAGRISRGEEHLSVGRMVNDTVKQYGANVKAETKDLVKPRTSVMNRPFERVNAIVKEIKKLRDGAPTDPKDDTFVIKREKTIVKEGEPDSTGTIKVTRNERIRELEDEGNNILTDLTSEELATWKKLRGLPLTAKVSDAIMRLARRGTDVQPTKPGAVKVLTVPPAGKSTNPLSQFEQRKKGRGSDKPMVTRTSSIVDNKEVPAGLPVSEPIRRSRRGRQSRKPSRGQSNSAIVSAAGSEDVKLRDRLLQLGREGILR
jgi:hypothetical protein